MKLSDGSELTDSYSNFKVIDADYKISLGSKISSSTELQTINMVDLINNEPFSAISGVDSGKISPTSCDEAGSWVGQNC